MPILFSRFQPIQNRTVVINFDRNTTERNVLSAMASLVCLLDPFSKSRIVKHLVKRYIVCLIPIVMGKHTI